MMTSSFSRSRIERREFWVAHQINTRFVQDGHLLVIQEVVRYNSYKWPYKWVTGVITPIKVELFHPTSNW